MRWGMEGDRCIVKEDVCKNDMQNLGGRLVLIFMRTDILVGGMKVLAVRVMVVVAVGLISFSEQRCLSVTEVDFSRAEIFELQFV